MRLKFQSSIMLAAASRSPLGTRRPEFDPVAVEVTVQVIIYDDPDDPEVRDAKGLIYPDGQTTILLPDVPPPPPGTTIQVLIPSPDPDMVPTVLEGTTTVEIDGLIGLIFP